MLSGLNGPMNRFFNSQTNRQFFGADRAGQQLLVQDGCSACGYKADGSRPSDSLQLSQPLLALQKTGLDLEKSAIVESSRTVSFNLQFIDEHIQSLTSNGFYDSRAQSIQFDFSFSSALTTLDPNTGEQRQEFFQFEFHLEASQVQTVWGQGEVEKDDILQFTHKILSKMSELRTEGKEIDGLALDDEDLQDLKTIDLRRLIKGVMRTLHFMRKIERMQGKDAGVWRLEPQADESTSAVAQQLEEKKEFRFSLQVTRIHMSGTGATENERSTDTPS